MSSDPLSDRPYDPGLFIPDTPGFHTVHNGARREDGPQDVSQDPLDVPGGRPLPGAVAPWWQQPVSPREA